MGGGGGVVVRARGSVMDEFMRRVVVRVGNETFTGRLS